MHHPRSLLLAALLVAGFGLQLAAGFRPEHFNAGKASPALPSHRAHCRLPHNCRDGREPFWQFSRLQASRRALLPGHPQPVVLANNAPLFAVGSARADPGPAEVGASTQSKQGFFSRLLGWFSRKPQQQPEEQEPRTPSAPAPAARTESKQQPQQLLLAQQPRKVLGASRNGKLKPRMATGKPTAQVRPIVKKKNESVSAASRSPRPLLHHRQVAQRRTQEQNLLPAHNRNVTLSQLAAVEKYRRRDHTASFTGAYNDRELEVALDGYGHLRCVLPYDVANHTALQFDPQALREMGKFAVQIADFDFEKEKVVLKVPGTGYWFSQMLLQQLFWQTARPGMEVSATVSRVQPATVKLRLSDFGNLPVTLPANAFTNETAGQLDPAMPVYVYNVTLRVDSVDPARHEAQWSVVSVQQRPRTEAEWLRLKQVAKRNPVPIKLTRVVNDIIEGDVVGYPSFNATLSLEGVDPDVASKLSDAARNQSVVHLFIKTKTSTMDDIKLGVPPWLRPPRAAQRAPRPSPVLSARMMEIVNSSLIIGLDDEPGKTARLELQHVPSVVAGKIIRSFAPGRSMNVSVYRRGEVEDYMTVQLSDWVDPDEERRLNEETSAIIKLMNATEPHHARILAQVANFTLIELAQHPGVPGWVHLGNTFFAKSLAPNETDTFTHLPVLVSGRHPTGLGFYASVAPLWRLDLTKLNTSVEYDATVVQTRNNTLVVRLREHPAFHTRISLSDPLVSISERWRRMLQPGTKLKVRIVRADHRSQSLWVVPAEPQYFDYDSPEWKLLNSSDPSQPFKAKVLEIRDSWRTLQLLDYPNITGMCWLPGRTRDAPVGAEVDVVLRHLSPQTGTALFGLAQPGLPYRRGEERARPEKYDAEAIANTSTVLDGRMLLHTTRGILVAVPTGKKGRGMLSLERLPSCDAGYLAENFSPQAHVPVRVLAYNERTDDVWLAPVLDSEVEKELEANLTAVAKQSPDVPLRAEYVCMIRRGMLVRLHDYPGVSAFVRLEHAVPPAPGVPIYVRRQEIKPEQRTLICNLVDYQKEFSSQIKPMTPYDAVTVQQLPTGLVVELTGLPGFQGYVPLQSLSSEFRREHTGEKFAPGTRLKVLSETALHDFGAQRKRPTFVMEGMDMKSRYERGGPLDPVAEYDADVANRVSGGLVVQLPQHGEIQGLLPFRLMNDLEKYRFLKHPESLQIVRVQTSEVDPATGRVIFKSLPLEPPPFARPNVTRVTATLVSESDSGFVLSVSNDSASTGVIPFNAMDHATIEALRRQLTDPEQAKEVAVTPLPGVEQTYQYVNVSTTEAEAAAASAAEPAWHGSVVAFDEHGVMVELPKLEHKIGFLLFEQMPKHVARRWRHQYSRGQAVNVTVRAVDDLDNVLVLHLANIPPELAGAEEAAESGTATQFEVSPAALKALEVGKVYRARATVLRPDGLVFQLEADELVNGWIPFRAMVRGLGEYWKKFFKPGMSMSVVLQNKGANGELQFATLRGFASYEDALMRAMENVPNRVYEAAVTEVVDGLGVSARLEALGYLALIPQESMPADFAHARPSWIFQPGDKVYVQLQADRGGDIAYRLATREQYLHQDTDAAEHLSSSNNNNHNMDALPDGTMFERWPGYNEAVAELAMDSWGNDDVPLEDEPPEIRRFHAPGLTHRDRMELWLRHHLQQGGELPPPLKPPARRNNRNNGQLVVRTTLDDEEEEEEEKKHQRGAESEPARLRHLFETTGFGNEAAV